MDNSTQETIVKTPVTNSRWLRTFSIGLGVIGVGLAIGIGGYLLGSNKTQTQAPPVISQISPTPTPDPTANWKTFTSQKYGFSVKYPANLLAQEETGYAYNLGITQGRAADGSAYFHNFDIFIVPTTFDNTDTVGYDYLTSSWINGLNALNVGDSKSFDTLIFKRLPDIQVAGQNALVVEVDPKNGNGTSQQRVFLKKGSYTYMLEKDYNSVDELIDFQNFLSTFKFTN